MTVHTCVFATCDPRQWTGRYAKVPGKTGFSLKSRNGQMLPSVEWNTEDGRATCFAIDCDAVRKISDAVQRAKRKAGGSGGGAFIINEYGQVLVPSSVVGGRRYLVGWLSGPLIFENPFDEEEPIDLTDCSHLQPGDPWKLPYVGIPHKLEASGRICFTHEGESEKVSMYPPHQDDNVIGALKSARGGSGCKFIVNYAGVVLTKSSQDGNWQAIYVGQIDTRKWFEMEECNA